MTDSRPIRDQDRFIIRLPDGMRDRIAARAKANLRSMNSEVVSMLMQVLENPDELELNQLESQLQMAQEAIHEQSAVLEGLDRRKFALIDEIEARRAAIKARSAKA